jgi:hypothetical protein
MEAGYYWNEDYRNPFLQNPRIYYGKNMAEALLYQNLKQNQEPDLSIKVVLLNC